MTQTRHKIKNNNRARFLFFCEVFVYAWKEICGRAESLNTHIESVFIDYEHAHVLGQQFAGMSYMKTEQQKMELKQLAQIRENVSGSKRLKVSV